MVLIAEPETTSAKAYTTDKPNYTSRCQLHRCHKNQNWQQLLYQELPSNKRHRHKHHAKHQQKGGPAEEYSSMPSGFHKSSTGDRKRTFNYLGGESRCRKTCRIQMRSKSDWNYSYARDSCENVDVTRVISPSKNSETVAASFCHSCGARFSVSSARFCCICGQKRIMTLKTSLWNVHSKRHHTFS